MKLVTSLLLAYSAEAERKPRSEGGCHALGHSWQSIPCVTEENVHIFIIEFWGVWEVFAVFF